MPMNSSSTSTVNNEMKIAVSGGFRPPASYSTNDVDASSNHATKSVASIQRLRLPTMLHLASGYGVAIQQYLAYAAMLLLSTSIRGNLYVVDASDFGPFAFATLSRLTSLSSSSIQYLGISQGDEFLSITQRVSNGDDDDYAL